MDHTIDFLRNVAVDKRNWRPRSVVWELTLACNLRCRHCGSRAGHKLPDEMDTEACLDLVGQLQALGCELVTLSGGEPTLRDDWDRIARAIADRKMMVNMVTNGVYASDVSPAVVAKRALKAGMCNVGVSIDGPEEIHDRIRGNGTFAKTAASVRAFLENGLSTTIMTTVNQLNVERLWDVRKVAMDLKARALRFQLAKPMGTMDDHRDWVIPPERTRTLLPELAKMKQQGGIDIRVGDSLGYYGKPDKILREWSWKNKRTRWGGCQAGMQALGIQANGDIKGCLSLQAARGDKDPFVEGNVREESLASIWYRPGAFAYNRELTLDKLTHDCKACAQASLCKGGARCISTAVDNTVTHDDYCYYRFTAENESLPLAAVGKSAAAAAALVLTVNTAACSSDTVPSKTDGGVYDTTFDTNSDSEDVTGTDSDGMDTASDSTIGTDTAILEYGVTPDYAVTPDSDSEALDTAVTDYGVAPEYGVTPETDADYGIWPDTASDTAVLEYGVVPDYGVTPEDSDSDSMDTASDTAVLEYGVVPDYGVTPEDTDSMTDDTSLDTAYPEYGITPDYGVTPEDTDSAAKSTDDTGMDTTLDYGIVPDYGVEPRDTDTEPQMDYGLWPEPEK